jgi:hypothetical protein
MDDNSAHLADLAGRMFAGELESALSEDLRAMGALERASGRETARRDGMAYETAVLLGIDKRFYRDLGTGVLSGLPAITWNGMDSFVYIPNPNAPFSYTTSAKLGSRTIVPKIMPTDGGSIPRILRAWQRFSSWGYAPAFIVHDWIFHGKKRKRLDQPISFEESALIMAEIIKTMMETGYTDISGRVKKLETREDTLFVMYKAVSSPIAKRLWDDDSTAVDVEWSGS